MLNEQSQKLVNRPSVIQALGRLTAVSMLAEPTVYRLAGVLLAKAVGPDAHRAMSPRSS